jgi:hypothetical protein
VSVFERRYREALLTRYPAWREPGRLLGPARGRRRGPRLWPAAAVAVAAALVALAIRPPAGGTGTPARLVAWPAGLNADAHLALGSTRLVAYQGREAAGWSRAFPPRRAWVVHLGRQAEIAAAAVLPGGPTLLVDRQGRSLWVAVVDAHGTVTARTLLASDAPPGRVWAETTPWQSFLVSTATSTWIVGAQGLVQARLAGGSNALALGVEREAGAVAQIVTWNPSASTLTVWTGTGRRIWAVDEPHSLRGAILQPVDTGPGFAFVTARQVVVPYPIGLTPMPKAAGRPWQYPSGLVTREALVRPGPRHNETILWTAPATASLPALPPGRPLALTGNGVLITLAKGRLEAATLGGRPMGTVFLSSQTVVAGDRTAYVATPRGLLVWGPFRLPPLPTAVAWSAAAGPWTAVFRLHPTREPLVVFNGGVVSMPMIPAGTPYIAATGPNFVNLAGTLTLTFRDPDPVRVTTLALRPTPAVSWFFAVPYPTEMRAPHVLSPAAGGTPRFPRFQQRAAWQTTQLVWEAMRRGWISVPDRFGVEVGWGSGRGALSWVTLVFTRSR